MIEIATLDEVILYATGKDSQRHKQLHNPVPPDSEKPRVIEEAEKAISAVIIQLLTRQPFFGQLLCSLRQVPTWTLPTMGVDGVNLFYNPTFTLALSKPERRGVLCHEVMHLAFRHIQRKRQRKDKAWNSACDYAVNVIIRDDLDMALPDWVLYRKDFKEKSAEEIYRTLQEEKREKQQGAKGKPQPQQGQGNQNQSQSGSGKDQDNDCPYCNEGDGDDGETDSFDQHIFNPDLDEDALTDKIVRAAEQAKRRGRLPAGIERVVNKLREHKVDWRKLIRGRALDIFTKVDYHPELRSILTGSVMGGRTYLPGLAKEEASILVLAVDTSGSIDKTILDAFAAEIKEVITMADRTIIMTCDADIHECVEVSKFDDIFEVVKFKGGGGTDFRPIFHKVEKLDIVPNLLVYFTDGYGAFPESPPDYPVLWAFTKHHSPAPWGDDVTVEAPEEGQEI